MNFLDTGVVVEVELPTTLTIGDAAYPVQQPYTITVDTYFKQTYDFAQDFVSSAVENRYFEYFTMASMLGSEFDNGVQKVPTFIHLTGCGDYVFTNWNEVQPELEFLIERTLAYTYMPDKVPTDTGDSSPAPKYVLGFEEGAYRDLSIGFTVPDDFELTRSTFQLSPDPIIAFARPIPYIGRCISDPILVDYFITYPVVVKAKDPLTGNAFRFAMQVYIKDNEPGVFDQSVGGYDAVYLTQLCQELDCPVDVGVADSGGNPIPQASVRFMGCNLGVTNSEGVLSARAPCGVGPLEIHKRGYGPLLEMRSSNELDGAEIAVTRMPSFTVQFHEVNVNQLPSGAYQITPQGIREINDLHGNQAVSLSIQSGTNSALCDNGVCQWYFEDRAGQIRSVPAGSYGIAASLLEGETVAGMFISLYSIGEELDGKQLHVYVPYYLPFKDIQDATEQAAEAEKLTALLELCGVGPVTDVAVTLEASCIKTEGELT